MIKKIWKSFYILLILIILVAPSYAQQVNHTVVVPHIAQKNASEKKLTDSSGADSTISFWSLPLWIKIACVAQAIIILILSIKIVPIIIGKLINNNKNVKHDAILEYIRDHPGSSISQVSRGTKINRNTLKYYIYNLVSSRTFILEKIGKYSRIYHKSNDYDDITKIIISYLGNETDKKILLDIANNPGITNVELSILLNIKRSSVHWHIEKFIKDSIIIYVQEGKLKKYYIKQEAEELLRKNLADNG